MPLQAVRSELYASNALEKYNTSVAEQNRNYATLNIFFSTLSYEVVSIDAAYTFMALLSDIGGALGLLLGATLLTIYETGEFFYQMIRDVIRLRKKVASEKTTSQKNVINVKPYAGFEKHTHM